LSVIRALGVIPVERHWLGNFLRLVIDFRRDAQGCQRFVEAAVEGGDALGPQRPRGAVAFAREDVHHMFLKVELNFEDARRVRHGSRRQPTGVEIYRG